MFHISNSYQLFADELTMLGLLYDIPELIENTDLFRSKSLQSDLVFLFNKVPKEIGLSIKVSRNKLVGTTLLDMTKKLRTAVISFFSQEHEDAAYKSVCEWLGQARTMRKEISRMRLLFSPAQLTHFMTDQIKTRRNITKLLGQIAQSFNLKLLLDSNNNTLLYHALRYHNRSAAVFYVS